MGEADIAHGSRHVRPPGVNGTVGEAEIGGEVPEQVEGHRHRRQEVGPQALMIEALMRLDDCSSSACGFEGSGGQEVRARFSRIVERQAAPDGSSLATRRRCDGLRSDRVTCGLAPLRLVEAQTPAEVGQLGPPRDVIVRLPAVRSRELLPGERLLHTDIVRTIQLD